MKTVRDFVIVMGAFALLMLLFSYGQAAPIEAVPNTSVQADQVWLMRNGTVVGKWNDTQFLNGRIVRLGATDIGVFCNPSPPSQPAQPFIVQPPAFEDEAPPKVDIDVAVDPEAPAPSLLEVIITVAGAVLGYFIGRKAASDDGEVDDEEKADVPPVVV